MPDTDPKALRLLCEEAKKRAPLRHTAFVQAISPDVLVALLDRLEAAERDRDANLSAANTYFTVARIDRERAETAERREREAHEAIARNDERHAEAIRAVRQRAERAERERDEVMLDGGLDLVRRAVVRAERAEADLARLRRVEEAADAYVYTLDVAPVLPLRDGASAVERAEMVARNRVRAGAEANLRAALKEGDREQP